MSVIDYNQKPIESEVFRFVSIRNPQRVTKTEAKLISVPYQGGSALFLDLVAALNDPANGSPEEKRTACKSIAISYQGGDSWIQKPKDLENLLPSFVGIYDWIQANIATLTIASVTTKLEGIEIPDTNIISQIWDNLFVQMILGGGGPTRAVLIEALVVNYLLENHLNADIVATDGQIRVMANARVVLPDEIFPLPSLPSPVQELAVGEDPEIEIARQQQINLIQNHLKASDELEDAISFLKEDKASIAYQGGVIEINSETAPLNPDFVLTSEVHDAFSSETQAILLENRLKLGARLSFCLEVVGKKLSKMYGEVILGEKKGRRIIATGGAIWEPTEKKELGDPVAVCLESQVPNIGSGEAYQSIYGGDAKCRIKPLGIADLMRVEQELCCYAPGEVAHIENIMQGEYKQRVTRRLRRTEETFVSVYDKEVTNERDTITTEQHEMQKASSTVIQEDMSFNVGLSAGFHGPVAFAEVSSGFALSTSTNNSSSSATSYAKSVTDRALQRVIERTHEEQIRKVIDEYEDTNTHGLDNSNGTAHVVGLYRWADKIYKAKVVNYGKRLMFEFIVPEPGAFHLWAMSKPTASNAVELEEPIDPRTPAVSQMGYGLSPLVSIGVYRTNYFFWGAAYGVTLPPPPRKTITVTATRNVADVSNTTNFSAAFSDIAIPENYKAVKAIVSVAMKETNLSSYPLGWTLIQVGGAPQQKFVQSGSTTFWLNQEVDTVSVSAIGSCDHFALNIIIECNVIDEHVTQWQADCYDKIMEAYFRKKEAFDQALSEAKAGYGNGIYGTNPLLNRKIEQNELRKACLNALFQGANFSSDAIANYGSTNDCLPPMAKTDCCAVYEGERAKFLEQVFDWDFMSYLFYPYFHAQKCRWKMLYQLQDADPDFLKFLQAGMARVLVPVREGFEETAMHFLSTGEIWSGGAVPSINSELYVSIVNELNPNAEAPKWESEPWEIRVPTTLTVLQCESGCASGDGLPCNCGTGVGVGTSSKMIGGDDVADPNG